MQTSKTTKTVKVVMGDYRATKDVEISLSDYTGFQIGNRVRHIKEDCEGTVQELHYSGPSDWGGHVILLTIKWDMGKTTETAWQLLRKI